VAHRRAAAGLVAAPPGLVVSLGWETDKPAGWYWTSPLNGLTATMAGGIRAAIKGEFADLADAVAHVRAHPQAPFDLAVALSDLLAGVPNEWDMASAELARRAVETLAWTPGYERGAARIAEDRVDGPVPVPVPAGSGGVDVAGQVLAMRDWLRLGLVRVGQVPGCGVKADLSSCAG
jgi:hypothetical protein